MVYFKEIPAGIRSPGAYFESDPSRVKGAEGELPDRVLIIAKGFVNPAEPDPVTFAHRVDSVQAASVSMGVNSQAAHMLADFRAVNDSSELWVLRLQDDADNETDTIDVFTFGGTAAEETALANFMVGGEPLTPVIPQGTTPVQCANIVADAAALRPELEHIAHTRWTATFGGTPADGDYVITFDSDLWDDPITVEVTRNTTPAANTDLATAAAAALQAAFAPGQPLHGIVRRASASAEAVTFNVIGGQDISVTCAPSDAGATFEAVQQPVVEWHSAHRGAATSMTVVGGNALQDPLRFDVPGGLTNTKTRLQSGAGAIDLEPVLAALPEDVHFTMIISCQNDDASISAVQDACVARSQAIPGMGCIGVFAYGGSGGTPAIGPTNVDALVATRTKGLAHNAERVTTLGYGSSYSSSWRVAATYGGAIAQSKNPAVPMTETYLPNVLGGPREARFTFAQRDELLKSGISTMTIDQTGRCYIQRAVTMHRLGPGGAPSLVHYDISRPRVNDALRYTSVNRIKTKFPRHIIIRDGVPAPTNAPTVSPGDIKNELIDLFLNLWSPRAWVDRSDFERFKTALIVEPNPDDPTRIDISLDPLLTSPAMVFAFKHYVNLFG